MAPYHHMMAHFPIALMTLAFVLIALRGSSNGEWVRRLDSTVLVFGLLVAVIGGIAAMATGLLIWPTEATITSPLGRNKILLASWTIALWAVILVLRWRVGAQIWDGVGRYLMLALGAFGALLAASTGSLGGHLMGSPSRFTGLLDQFGWNVYQTYLAPGWVLIVMLLVGAAGIVVGLTARRQAA